MYSSPLPSSLGMKFKRVARSWRGWSDQSRESEILGMVAEFADPDGTLDKIPSTKTPSSENHIPKAPAPFLVTETSTTEDGKVDTPPRRVMRLTAKANLTEAGPIKLSPKRFPPKKAPVWAPIRKAPLRGALAKKSTPKKATPKGA